MGRIITNKYKVGDFVTKHDFYDGIAVDDVNEQKKIAMGRIILTVKSGQESIWVLNENNVPKVVAQPLDVALPAEITEAISNAIDNAIDEVENYADREITRKLNDFSLLVISSADTMYSTLKGYIDTLSANTESTCEGLSEEINTERNRLDELSAYTMNLKFSDHFMITDDEYRMLSTLGELDGENISNETYDMNGIERGTKIYFNDEIYYCIYGDDGSGGGESGSSVTISGTTIELDYDISGTTIEVDDLVTIEDNHTLVFND